MAPPFRVDPVALDGAGKNVAGAVDGWGTALSALNAALSGTGGMGGQDPAGVVFARAYDDSATALLEAMVDLSNGAGRAADGIRASATNYSRAEVSSNIDGKGGVPLPAAAPTAHVKTGTPPSAVGSDVGEPPGWFLVEPFIGMVWPDGDSSKCRAGGTAWSAVQAAFTAQQKGLSGAQATVAAQEIPEGPKIGTAFTNIDSAVNEVAGHAATIAKGLNDYAAKIDTAQSAVKDLLARLVNPMTGVRQVVDWVTGEDDDEIKKIAHDIAVIVNQFKDEVAALATLLTPIIAAVEMVISTMKSLIAMEIEHIGGEIYDTAAPIVNAAAAFGQAMIENPGQTIQMAAGAALFGLGTDVLGAAGVGEALTAGAATPVAAPVAAAGGLLMAGGAALGIPAALDLTTEAVANPATVMHARTKSNAGGFKPGHSGYGKQAERRGIEQYKELNPESWVSTEKKAVRVTNEDGKQVNTFPDGFAKKPDGTWEAIGVPEYEAVEVKSGAAKLSENQTLLKEQLERGEPAYATIKTESGQIETIKITSFDIQRVPSEGPR
ncbi:putative alanine and proline rich protein [Mycobacteroides abscessus subsp. bolletii]|uniref:NAD(+)--arginine ADP-ribosyltransferase n=1 Tax=Mycobacteroides abscessus TaxID=36809 RepID=UPI00092CA16C|nr:NAD(+)--arginine ADP-ribosyltransferase [Mycobacteroides abscessus]SHY57047.1 putative alanine and proline rich protein [Mycobacteroides abscessus subsp. bolletii]SHY66101.1 putative alanine and proline rich protein [Mycobacteroides abscessus subsp. bolletii]